MLYQLGEGAAEETLKPGSGALGQLATGQSSDTTSITAALACKTIAQAIYKLFEFFQTKLS